MLIRDLVRKPNYRALTGITPQQKIICVVIGWGYAEMLVDITEKQGIYFAIAFLHDSSYDLERIGKLLPILEAQKDAIKSEAKHD